MYELELIPEYILEISLILVIFKYKDDPKATVAFFPSKWNFVL